MSSEQHKKFKSLAPANDVSGVEPYIEWLDEIVNDDSYGNIAVTGDLGIGKSSLIRTFECKKQYKFTYLSASDLGYRFDENQNLSAEMCQNRIEEIQSKLEKDLLVQLVSLCKHTDIPKSRFRTVPENETRCSKIKSIVYSMICGLAILCLGKLVANFFLSDADFLPTFNFVPFQFGIIVAFLGLSSVLFVYSLLKNYKLSKLSLGKEKKYSASAEIDIKNLEPETLDTHLHEILYLFEQIAEKKSHKSKKSMPVFIIEDLDRYRSDICLPILTKLKQINNMLNNRFRNQHDTYGIHYKFIYLLNDRIFDASEKDIENNKNIPYNYEDSPYKFFDIIIPVLPKLGFTNSSDTIRKRFGTAIEQDFIDEICRYVYDYRKLNDIENEFTIYKERFKSNDRISETKLLAFVIYKVFYKAKYDQLFKAKDGAPISELLKRLLMPDVYLNVYREVETLEGILEERFQDVLFDILQMTDAVKSKYKSEIVVNNPEKDYSGENLSKINLTKVDLHGRNFVNSDLSGADLSYSNLNSSDLSRANLRGTILCDADLREADLTDTDLSNANLSGADLSGANLRGAILCNADLSEADLSDTDLCNANLNGVNLHEANLSNSKLIKASLVESKLTCTCLFKSNLMMTNLTGADLTDAKLKATNLQHAQYNYKTIFPKNYKPNSHGMVEVRSSLHY